MKMGTLGSYGWLDQAIAAVAGLFHHLSVASDEFIGTMLGLDD